MAKDPVDIRVQMSMSDKWDEGVLKLIEKFTVIQMMFGGRLGLSCLVERGNYGEPV